MQSKQDVKIMICALLYSLTIMFIIAANPPEDIIPNLAAFVFLLPFVLISGIITIFSFFWMAYVVTAQKNTAHFWIKITLLFLYMTLVPYIFMYVSIAVGNM